MLGDVINHATSFGLLVDIAGAVFIAKSVFYRRNQDIFDISGAYMGYSKARALEEIIAKREALFGTFLIVIGFLGQLDGSIEKAGHPHINWAFIILFSVLLAAVCLIAHYLIEKWSEKTIDKLVHKYKKEKNTN